MYNISVNEFKRINKAAARKAYNDGFTIYILPYKFKIINQYIKPILINKAKPYHDIPYNGFNNIIARNHEFDTIINCYEYYNCNNITGKYAAYYIRNEGE